jgi:hypothetical protein
MRHIEADAATLMFPTQIRFAVAAVDKGHTLSLRANVSSQQRSQKIAASDKALPVQLKSEPQRALSFINRQNPQTLLRGHTEAIQVYSPKMNLVLLQRGRMLVGRNSG